VINALSKTSPSPVGMLTLLSAVPMVMLALASDPLLEATRSPLTLLSAFRQWLLPAKKPKGGVSLDPDNIRAAAPAEEVDTPRVKWLGHAGFVYQFRNTSILMDPWFFQAFCWSWFPFPNNRWMLEDVTQYSYDYLYISHLHEDHFDERVLKQVPKTVTIICADYVSKTLELRFRELGFNKIMPLSHLQSCTLSDGVKVTMILDLSAKEDSGLLIESPLAGRETPHRFLHLNDLNTRQSELPKNVDILSSQFAGAQWYPGAYHYDDEDQKKISAKILNSLFNVLSNKVKATEAKALIPSAGVACFLDTSGESNDVFRFNDFSKGESIFPCWDQFAEKFNFKEAFPDVEVLRLLPGDRVTTRPDGSANMVSFPGRYRPESSTWRHETEDRLRIYSEMRREEWMEMYEPVKPVTMEEMQTYIKRLQRENKVLMKETGLKKHLSFHTKNLHCYAILGLVGSKVGPFDQAPPEFQEEYSFTTDDRILRLVIEDKICAWEDALLSMRVRLKRNPDVYDMNLMAIMRYGDKPAITQKVAELHGMAKENMEMIEHPSMPGVKFQRYCPHQGEDMKNAVIVNGVITCPRHGWEFCANTGKCLKGGNASLKMEKLQW